MSSSQPADTHSEPSQLTFPTEKLPKGFAFSGVPCGIKPSGSHDLALIVAEHEVAAAGVYTQNQIVAAPVVLCRARTPSASIRAVVTNSGNANACTGERGDRDAATMCQRVADRIGCRSEQVLVMSTGVIGQPLPMDRVQDGIDRASETLGADGDHFEQSANAILTTDKSAKTSRCAIDLSGTEYRIAAMAKGAGMIAPNMATMLAVITTDAPLSPAQCQQAITEAAEESFNRVSVDGHTSTNDTALLLASGQGEPLDEDDFTRLKESIIEISLRLARMMVADGEGASHVMALHVKGAQDDLAARQIAKTVAESPLVKTAITGGDPNWGRMVSAAGYAPATIDPQHTSLSICGCVIYQNGNPVDFDAKALSATMKSNVEVAVELTVGTGTGSARFWASDLTTEYVRFNSEYTT